MFFLVSRFVCVFCVSFWSLFVFFVSVLFVCCCCWFFEGEGWMRVRVGPQSVSFDFCFGP